MADNLYIHVGIEVGEKVYVSQQSGNYIETFATITM